MATGGRRVVPTRSFERDSKRVVKRGKSLARLVQVIEQIRTGQALAPRHRDHALKGDWVGYRECHVEADWLLIYQLDDADLVLVRTGTLHPRPLPFSQ